MQDTIAGNKNAGNVMRKKTPREHKMPNENAAQDTLACTSLAHCTVNDSTRACLKVRIVTKTTADEDCLNGIRKGVCLKCPCYVR